MLGNNKNKRADNIDCSIFPTHQTFLGPPLILQDELNPFSFAVQVLQAVHGNMIIPPFPHELKSKLTVGRA